MKPVALVTGANKGLGKEIARQLLGRRMTVVLGARDPRQGLEAARDIGQIGIDVTSIRVDVTDTGTIKTARERLLRDFGRLDVLVNNAGTFVGATAVETTAAVLRQTFEVNVFGVVAVMHQMLSLIQQSSSPRIVNVSSTTASLGLTSRAEPIPGDASRRLAYASSKAALNMLTIQYAAAFREDPKLSHIKINAATPGYVATDMNRHRATRNVAEGARIVVELATLPEDGPSGGFFDEHGPVEW